MLGSNVESPSAAAIACRPDSDCCRCQTKKQSVQCQVTGAVQGPASELRNTQLITLLRYFLFLLFKTEVSKITMLSHLTTTRTRFSRFNRVPCAQRCVKALGRRVDQSQPPKCVCSCFPYLSSLANSLKIGELSHLRNLR